MSTLITLIERGDKVSIEAGQLVIIPVSGQPVPPIWLAHNQAAIIRDILVLVNVQDIYVYKSHSVGKYGPHNSEGLTLQFESILTHESYYAVFNVSLKRARSTKAGKKGTRLPKGQFIPPKEGNFCRFWAMTGLKIPVRNSTYYEYMGNLKNLYFVANPHDSVSSRLQSATLQHIDISFEQVVNAINDLQATYK